MAREQRVLRARQIVLRQLADAIEQLRADRVVEVLRRDRSRPRAQTGPNLRAHRRPPIRLPLGRIQPKPHAAPYTKLLVSNRAMSDDDLKFAVVALSAVFFVIDPLANVPIFLTITACTLPRSASESRRAPRSRRGSLLSIFAARGRSDLQGVRDLARRVQDRRRPDAAADVDRHDARAAVADADDRRGAGREPRARRHRDLPDGDPDARRPRRDRDRDGADEPRGVATRCATPRCSSRSP